MAEGVQTAEQRARYRANYDRVFGSRRKAKPGSYVFVPSADRLVHVDDLDDAQAAETRALMRKRDSKNIESESMGCTVKQVEDFRRRFGDEGIDFVQKGPHKCVARLADRAAKFRLMRKRGMVDFDEVRG